MAESCSRPPPAKAPSAQIVTRQQLLCSFWWFLFAVNDVVVGCGQAGSTQCIYCSLILSSKEMTGLGTPGWGRAPTPIWGCGPCIPIDTVALWFPGSSSTGRSSHGMLPAETFRSSLGFSLSAALPVAEQMNVMPMHRVGDQSG